MDRMECTRMSAEVVDEIKTFFEDGWIEEVLFPVKSGKEATVYCCRACQGRGEAYFALKAYRSRQDRNFRNAAIYKEGRVVGMARVMRGVRNKSKFGRRPKEILSAGSPKRPPRLEPDPTEDRSAVTRR